MTTKVQKIAAFLKSLVNMTDHVNQEGASLAIKSSIAFRGPNVLILACAIIIASVGLNLNSIPVIVGAMLISPLMGPILGLGLGLGTNDTLLVKSALSNFATMVVISIISSTLFFLVSPLNMEHPTELLARTNPTIYDVLIALFGGFAGILETSRKDKGNTVIPGVAIATALMPPLCTVGYGIANLDPKYIIGALYLFFINSVFIALATFITIKYLHYPQVVQRDEAKQRKTNRVIAIIMIILIVPSILSAIQIVKENNFNRDAQKLVAQNTSIGKSYIYDYKTNLSTKPATLELYIAGEALEEAERDRLFEEADRFGIARSQITFHDEATYKQEKLLDSDVLKGIITGNDKKVQDLDNTITQLNDSLAAYRQKELPTEMLAKEITAQYADVIDVSMTRGENFRTADGKTGDVIIAIINTKNPLREDDKTKISNWLKVRLNSDSVIVITSSSK